MADLTQGLAPEYTLQNTNIDYACIGEGEESVLEFCQMMSSGKEPCNVPGIITKKHMEYKRRNPPADLDSLPFQVFNKENIYNIQSDGKVFNGDTFREYRYVTRCSRGCPFRCTFCSNHQIRGLYDSGKYLRQRSPANVIEELKQHVQNNPECTGIRFYDDTFPYKHSWVEEFCDLYGQEIKKPFEIWLNPNTTKEKDIALLKKAGLITGVMGIESGSEQTRKNVFLRGETTEKIIKADHLLSKYELGKIYDFVIDHPWESKTELEETFNLLMNFKRPFIANLHGLILFPKTGMAQKAIEEGMVKDDDEIIDNIVADPYSSSRNFFWWGAGVPEKTSTIRTFWFQMIFKSSGFLFPKPALRFLANYRVFRTGIMLKLILFMFNTTLIISKLIRVDYNNR